jgi:hypothetical protein
MISPAHSDDDIRSRHTQSDTSQTSTSDKLSPRLGHRDIIAYDNELNILHARGLGHEPSETKVEVIASI